MPTMSGRQNAMPQNPVPAAPPSTRPHQHREVDGILKTVQSFDGVAEDIILSVRVVGELELGYKLGCVHSVRQKHGGLRCCSSTKVSLSATSWSTSSRCSSSSHGFGCSSQYSWTCFGVTISQAG